MKAFILVATTVRGKEAKPGTVHEVSSDEMKILESHKFAKEFDPKNDKVAEPEKQDAKK